MASAAAVAVHLVPGTVPATAVADAAGRDAHTCACAGSCAGSCSDVAVADRRQRAMGLPRGVRGISRRYTREAVTRLDAAVTGLVAVAVPSAAGSLAGGSVRADKTPVGAGVLAAHRLVVKSRRRRGRKSHGGQCHRARFVCGGLS